MAAVAYNLARYLVAFSNQLQQIAEVLLHEGHGLRPGNEARAWAWAV